MPIRRIKPMVDRALLAQLSPTFDRMYAENGRASMPPVLYTGKLVVQPQFRDPSSLPHACVTRHFNILLTLNTSQSDDGPLSN